MTEGGSTTTIPRTLGPRGTNPLKATQRKEVADSRTRLLDAAKELMADQGFERVTTAAIARKAGTSESQLVRYFGGKAGLLESILNEGWAPLNPEIGRLIASSTTARDALINTFAKMIQAFDKDPELAKLLLFESRRLRGESDKIRLTQGFLDFYKQLLALIEWGQKDGSFNSWLHAPAILSALLGACEGMIRDRLLAAQQNKPRPFPETQIRAVFEALIAGLGHQGPSRRK